MASRKVLCFIVARNFGDITFMSTYFRELAARGYADEYIVWTRAPMGFLFDGIPNCTVLYSKFPVGSFGNFRWRDCLAFLRSAWNVRRMRPTVSLDMVGDFRERFFARLIGSHRHLHIGWTREHPHRGIIRTPFGVGRPAVLVGPETPSVYAAYTRFVDYLLREAGLADRPGPLPPLRTHEAVPTVGLHPSASQACKLWPQSHWTQLTQALLGAGVDVVAFGAPGERDALEAQFASFGDRVRISTGSIPEFARELARLDVLVGLDSFSVHMAENVGTPSVMIVGPNDPALFAPPRAAVLSDSGGCAAWPCYNRPSCVGTAGEYVCIRSISVARVQAAVAERLLASRAAEEQVSDVAC
ncbi:glycosyltransferase family 9 protein [Ideonella azotifigens]|uniref:Glycosyltransferase family 9 protein n=2 Tax=Ideonella azotifigens TaxID=513160 RepID=A0ABN1K0R4_9BURK|nr:glycosyltransferase family 9 protein [Ideonella azotifigens]MCD2341591.1 glycosyltransferase family 9 protein [Ideonella azotifigens]